MPAFGRLHKHSNRSQHALVDSLAAGAPAVTTATRASPGVNVNVNVPQNPGAAPPAAPPDTYSAHSAHSHSNSPATTATPISALSSTNPTGFSSSESFETRPQQPQQQQQQQQQQLQQPPPPLYSNSNHSSESPLGPDSAPSLQQVGAGPGAGTGTGGAPVFDGRRQHRSRGSDFADAGVGRSQSQRYSSILPANQAALHPSSAHPSSHPQQHQQQQQQQQLQNSPYGPVSSSSVDDLPGTNSSNPPTVSVVFPERRSARKLIKGIFGGSSSRSSNNAPPPPDPSQQQPHGHAHHSSYDNTAGLARRPSKRAPNPPNPPHLTTGFSAPLQGQPPPDHDWHAQQDPYSQQSSPLQGVDEADEYRYSAHDSNRDLVSQDPRYPLNTSIRQVSGELETSPYDDAAYRQQQPPPPQPPPHQHQLQQPQRQQHPQLQTPLSPIGHSPSQDQLRYDQSNYEQQTVPSPPSVPALQQFPYGNTQQGHFQHPGDPRLVTSHLNTIVPQQQGNPETLSQVSRESPVTDSDQRSTNQQSAQTSPAVTFSTAALQDVASTQNLPPVQGSTQTQQGGMTPPAGGPPPSRRAQEAVDKSIRGQPDPPGGPPPPGYRHSTASIGNIPGPPTGGPGAPPTPGFRTERTPNFDGAPGEQGRNSPQPATMQDPAEAEKAFKDLLVKYKNVKRLYFDGKSQIEQLTAQVEHLQNAVANQRMSQSRTALDDNEYSTRFNRLNGAINNLSFNIRKDWRTVPQWLEQYVSADALKTGKQEMTAVGRAVVSRWLVEELFDKCFHPGLEPGLSAQLKEIELSIRGNAYTMHSQEEFDALTTKIVNWRMATLDGLKGTLDPATTAENRAILTSKATTNLTACLYQYLGNPPPPGVEGSTSMIVELAVAIAANLPLESRDVAITLPLPGDTVQPHLMDVEKAGLPVLEAQKSETSAEGDEDSDRDKNGKGRGDKAKTALPKDAGLVRFAGFMALEVRGRQVLMKAPVWTL